MTRVVNIHKEPYDVYIGRAGRGQDGYFGNPFRLKQNEERGATIEWYTKYFYNRLKTDPEFKRRILDLKNKTLGCFCDDPNKCHGGVIVSYLNSLSNETDI